MADEQAAPDNAASATSATTATMDESRQPEVPPHTDAVSRAPEAAPAAAPGAAPSPPVGAPPAAERAQPGPPTPAPAVQAAPAPSPPQAAGPEKAPPTAPPEAPPVDDDPPGCDCEEGAPAWVMTFGDLMSLLLTFFILLYSMSSSDSAKFEAAAQSLREALGEMSGELTSAALAPTDEQIAAIVGSEEAIMEASMELIEARLEQFVSENDLQESVDVVRDANGVYVRMQDQALFPPGSATVNPQSVDVVGRLGQIITMIGIPVIVSGHTDNVPIRSQAFASNWELSASRAAGIARLVVGAGHGPDAITVEAYGEYKPLGDNDTPEGRSRNRRVEIYYSRQTIENVLEDRGVLEGDESDDPAAAATDGNAGADP